MSYNRPPIAGRSIFASALLLMMLTTINISAGARLSSLSSSQLLRRTVSAARHRLTAATQQLVDDEAADADDDWKSAAVLKALHRQLAQFERETLTALGRWQPNQPSARRRRIAATIERTVRLLVRTTAGAICTAVWQSRAMLRELRTEIAGAIVPDAIGGDSLLAQLPQQRRFGAEHVQRAVRAGGRSVEQAVRLGVSRAQEVRMSDGQRTESL